MLQAIAKDFDPKYFKAEGGNLNYHALYMCGIVISNCSDLSKADDLLDLMDSAY